MQCHVVQADSVPLVSKQHPLSNIEGMLYYDQISATLMHKLRNWTAQLKPEEGIQWRERSGQHRKTFEFGISFKTIEEVKSITRIEMPSIIAEVRDELVKLFIAHLAEKDPSKYESCILTIYLEGDAISAHTDRAYFGPDILSLVILPDSSSDPRKPPSRLQFFHPVSQEKIYISEQGGTAFLLQGELRKRWKHELLPVATKRISLQFRTVNEDHVRTMKIASETNKS